MPVPPQMNTCWPSPSGSRVSEASGVLIGTYSTSDGHGRTEISSPCEPMYVRSPGLDRGAGCQNHRRSISYWRSSSPAPRSDRRQPRPASAPATGPADSGMSAVTAGQCLAAIAVALATVRGTATKYRFLTDSVLRRRSTQAARTPAAASSRVSATMLERMTGRSTRAPYQTCWACLSVLPCLLLWCPPALPQIRCLQLIWPSRVGRGGLAGLLLDQSQRLDAKTAAGPGHQVMFSSNSDDAIPNHMISADVDHASGSSA